MRRRIFLLGSVGLAALACAPAAPAAVGKPAGGASGSGGYTRPELLAETGWLAEHLKDPDVRLVDMRTREKYDAGHLPGAVWLDGAKLKDPDEKLYVVRPELFAADMGALGVGPTTRVVAYDDNGGLWPARLWWVLGYYGHGGAQILNGGWNKWTKESRPTPVEAVRVTPAAFSPKVNPAVIALVDQVEQATASGEYVIVDARTAGEYNGSDVRAARGGHVPNAVNVDWQRTVSADDVKVWKAADELRKLYEQAGVTPDKKVITYCQTGVRAAHTLFTLRLLGYDLVQNYDGSWAEWGNNPRLPIKK